MAIRVTGNWLAYLRSYFDYELIETDSDVTMTIVAGINTRGNFASGNKFTQTLRVTGFETFTEVKAKSNSNTNGYYPKMDTRTYTWQKTSEVQAITVSYSFKMNSTELTPGTSTATTNFDIAAKKGGMYVGEGGVAKTITRGYIGVDGVARTISKIYVGVDGIAKQIM